MAAIIPSVYRCIFQKSSLWKKASTIVIRITLDFDSSKNNSFEAQKLSAFFQRFVAILLKNVDRSAKNIRYYFKEYQIQISKITIPARSICFFSGISQRI